jgi:glycosyltransferase involved in cell wall biosynthesis
MVNEPQGDKGPGVFQSRPTVSVVIPGYQSAGFISDAVAYALRQTVAPLEVIVVDDGSSDETAERARTAGARVIRQSNLGVSTARNVGVAAARGEWIALLDSDDRWEPEKLECQLRAIAAVPDAVLVFCDYYEFAGTRRLRERCVAGRAVYRTIRKVDLGCDAFSCERASLLRAYFLENFIQPTTLLVRRDRFLACGGFDPEIRLCEDWEFVLRVLSGDGAALVVERALAGYHLRSGSASRRYVNIYVAAIELSERIAREPRRYPGGAADAFARALGGRLRATGLAFAREGDFREAHRYLRQSREARPGPLAVALEFAGAALDNRPGQALHGALRSAWRRVKGST